MPQPADNFDHLFRKSESQPFDISSSPLLIQKRFDLSMSSKDGTKVTKAKGKAVESDVKDDWEDSSDEEQQPESQLENDLTTSTTHPGPKPQQKEEDFPPLSNEKISRAQGRAKGTSSPASG